MKENNKKGISLIVLVITIIVIIILAAAVILTLTDNNPIENAKQAAFINDLDSFKSELDMYKASEYAKTQGNFIQAELQADEDSATYLGVQLKDGTTDLTINDIIQSLGKTTKYNGMFEIENGMLIFKGTDLKKREWAPLADVGLKELKPKVTFGTNGGTDPIQVSTTVTVTDTSGSGLNLSTLKYIWDIQNVTEPSSGWTVLNNGETLLKSGTGVYYLWVKAEDNDLNNVVIKTNMFVVGDADIPVTTIQTEHKTFTGATTGFSYNNPVIPAGFIAVNTKNTSWNNLLTDWNNGLVIQDSIGNQFVWVPVDGTDVSYAKNFNYLSSYGATVGNTTDDTLPLGITSESEQINTYKGFYIARYEAGNSSGVVVSKKGANVWINTNYTNAKTNSQNMYTNPKVKSGLLTGTMWDTTMKWIQNVGDKSVTDSRAWGNHYNSIAPASIPGITGYSLVKIAGFGDYWKAKNIYDLAGNTVEWTNEKFSTYYISRGGHAGFSGISDPASHRHHDGVNNQRWLLVFPCSIIYNIV